MATAPKRAPRGTRQIVRAFHEAVDAIPEASRNEAAKAALTKIRDDLKAAREKARVNKTEVRQSTGRDTRTVRRPRRSSKQLPSKGTAAEA